jgi:hypothetical protein
VERCGIGALVRYVLLPLRPSPMAGPYPVMMNLAHTNALTGHYTNRARVKQDPTGLDVSAHSSPGPPPTHLKLPACLLRMTASFTRATLCLSSSFRAAAYLQQGRRAGRGGQQLCSMCCTTPRF